METRGVTYVERKEGEHLRCARLRYQRNRRCPCDHGPALHVPHLWGRHLPRRRIRRCGSSPRGPTPGRTSQLPHRDAVSRGSEALSMDMHTFWSLMAIAAPLLLAWGLCEFGWWPFHGGRL